MTVARLTHPFDPLFGPESRVLILGSFPSVKSREQGFYYGHPQNRFWRVLAALWGEETPDTVPKRRAFILTHRLALWDVIAGCAIEGSSDASIRGARPNELRRVLDACPVEAVFCNGQTAYALHERLIAPQTGRHAVCLPSTSPANARWTLEALTEAWRPVALAAGADENPA